MYVALFFSSSVAAFYHSLAARSSQQYLGLFSMLYPLSFEEKKPPPLLMMMMMMTKIQQSRPSQRAAEGKLNRFLVLFVTPGYLLQILLLFPVI